MVSKIVENMTQAEDAVVAKKNAKKSAKKTVEKVVVPVQKKVKAEKPAKKEKVSVTLTAFPIVDLNTIAKVPTWVYANIPAKVSKPKDGEFSYIDCYLIVRDMAKASGQDYRKLAVGKLLGLLNDYALTHPETAVAKRMKSLTKGQDRDLRARLQWCIVAVLAVWDAQVAAEKVAAEKKEDVPAK